MDSSNASDDGPRKEVAKSSSRSDTKLVIKARLGNEFRKLPIYNPFLTYDELILMMQRLFKNKLDTMDEVTIKYKDEDGDMITINDSDDISFAIQTCRNLNIVIHVEGKYDDSSNSPEAIYLIDRLRNIRNEANSLIETLATTKAPNVGDLSRYLAICPPCTMTCSPESNGSEKKNAEPPKEFDPLNNDKPKTTPKSVDGGDQSSYGGPQPEQPATITPTVQHHQAPNPSMYQPPKFAQPPTSQSFVPGPPPPFGALPQPQQQQQQQPPPQQQQYNPGPPRPQQQFNPPPQQQYNSGPPPNQFNPQQQQFNSGPPPQSMSGQPPMLPPQQQQQQQQFNVPQPPQQSSGQPPMPPPSPYGGYPPVSMAGGQYVGAMQPPPPPPSMQGPPTGPPPMMSGGPPGVNPYSKQGSRYRYPNAPN